MKLEEMRICNFRQYYGEQTVGFSTRGRQNVTVFHGVNGAGKTSLFLALNWCLYQEGTEGLNIISKRAKEETEVGNYLHVYVELHFNHLGRRYIARREIKARREEDRWLEYEPQFSLTEVRDGRAKEVSNPINILNAILPANARTYFFFDGEKIDDFAKPEAAKEVETAIYNVLKLETFTRSVRHLKSIASEYHKELQKISTGNLRQLTKEEEKIRQDLEDLDGEENELKDQRQDLENQIEDLDERLRELEWAKNLQEKRDLLDDRMSDKNKRFESVESEIRSIASRGALLVAGSVYDQAKSILDDKTESNYIPPLIRKPLIDKILNSMECICGRDFEEDSDEYRNLLNLLTTVPSSKIVESAKNTEYALTTLQAKSEEMKSTLDELMQERTALQDEIAELHKQMDDISEQLQDSEHEDVGKLEKKRREMNHSRDSIIARLSSIETERKGHSKRLKDLEKLQEDEMRKQQNARSLGFKRNLAQNSADAVQEIYQAFATDTRRSIEDRANEIFRKLIWKDSHFRGITLSESYRLDIVDRYGSPARLDLSAGERQVLSLSFITAMANVASEIWDVEAPLVMDTPFGRLSSHHREAITENLPLLEDQLVLFITDEELHGKARENLDPYIGKEYQLHFDKDTSCTGIEEVC